MKKSLFFLARRFGLMALVGAGSLPVQSENTSYDESLYVLGVMVAAASDVAQEGDIKSYSLLMSANPQIERSFPLRARVRESVKAWPDSVKRRILDQFVKYPSYSSIYNAFFVETLGPPPLFVAKDAGGATKFNPTFQHIFDSRGSWQKLLAEVYSSQKIADLWKRDEKDWKKLQPTPSHVDEIKKRVIAYMRLDSASINRLPKYSVILSPLASPGNGGNIFPVVDEAVLVVGPADPLATDVITAHEFMHFPLNQKLFDPQYRLLEGELSEALESSECAFKKVTQNWGYVVWWNYASEALIRAASNRLIGRSASSEFLYENDFSEMLASYEADPSRSFEEFFASALLKLKKHCN